MKTKTSLIATAVTIAMFGSANAIVTPAGNQTIDITGSTAGRSTVNTKIIAQLGGAASVAVRYWKKDGSATTAGSADGAIYKGTYNSQTVIVRTFWAGSASGDDYVSNQVLLTNKFLDISFVAGTPTPGASQVGVGSTYDQLVTAGVTFQAAGEKSEFGYSDVHQSSTPFQSVPLGSETSVFVIPFVVDRTEGLTGVTNFTSQQARMFTGGGIAPKSYFTGVNPGDTGTDVYAVGRDYDSGTRIAFAAETGIGVYSDLTQYTFTLAGSGNTQTISNPVATTGQGGYASGGDVAKILGATGYNCVGYLGLSDAATAEGLGAVRLTFNGVPFSQANVKNGSYTYWSYYQSILSSATTDTNALGLHGDLETALLAITTSDSAINLNDMAVSRQADGAKIDF